jgi:hypothetical protein
MGSALLTTIGQGGTGAHGKNPTPFSIAIVSRAIGTIKPRNQAIKVQRILASQHIAEERRQFPGSLTLVGLESGQVGTKRLAS